MPEHNEQRVVALVAAKEAAGRVDATVAALVSLASVHDVVVVDDGSTDGTGEEALAAGARVLRLPRNLGKGAALRAGVAATPEADVYLLVDADVGDTATRAATLLEPVVAGEADLAIGVLPAAGKHGGIGLVRDLAATAIRLATGSAVRAPLSGQRAVRAELLRSLPLAERFGLETAMTIDARRQGARVVELDVAMDHRHRGRSVAGFRHRAGQGADIVRALWPRLTTPAQRMAAIVASFALVAAVVLWAGSRSEPSSAALASRPSKVVVFGFPRLSPDDIGTGAVPNLDGMARDGASAVATVRTAGIHPSTTEGYATLGAGTRIRADERAAHAYDGPTGGVVVSGAAATIALNEGRHLSSHAGALGQALHRAGVRTAVVGNADHLSPSGELVASRPAPVALMNASGVVDGGHVGRDLLIDDPTAPGGWRADPAAIRREMGAALARADVVLVDPGDMDRAASAGPGPGTASAARSQAMAATDRILGEVAAMAGPDALVLVVSVAPPDQEWRLTPMVARGPGVTPGQLHSPSTQRQGLVTLTDVAPTVLAALGAEVPDGMIGHALRHRPGEPALALAPDLDRDARFRENLYFKVTITYIVLQAVVYLLAIVAFRLGGVGRASPALRLVVLAFSAWPLATFLGPAVPHLAGLGGWGTVVLLAIDAGIVALALRARRHPLSPLAWICGATVAVLVADVATGARLQLSSFLGYSPYTAARFTGLGNAAFAALASTTILLAALHVHRAPRRREALVTVGSLFALVLLVDGSPWLGSDVGGILTLVPVFGLTLVALAGRRLSWRTLAAAAAVTATVMAVAIGIDLLRPPDVRTHLGQLVERVQNEGWEPLTTVLSRKAAGSLRTFGSPWTWTIPIITMYGLYVLARARGWSRLLPAHSALRAGAVGMLAAGLLGCAVNDSGVVVTAVVFVYIGPFLTLLAVEREWRPAVMLDPRSPPSPRASPVGTALSST